MLLWSDVLVKTGLWFESEDVAAREWRCHVAAPRELAGEAIRPSCPEAAFSTRPQVKLRWPATPQREVSRLTAALTGATCEPSMSVGTGYGESPPTIHHLMVAVEADLQRREAGPIGEIDVLSEGHRGAQQPQRSIIEVSKGDDCPSWSPRSLEPTSIDRVEKELRPALLSGPSSVDRLVFDSFLRWRKRSRGAVVALSERIMVTNVSAAELLLPSDRPVLWAQAQVALTDGCRPTGEVVLSCGVSVLARFRAVLAQDLIVGALVQLSTRPRTSSRSTSPARSGVDGWRSLTDTERAIAEAVARGLTNREAGRRLFLSPHTVDSHLRQIFRKLGIRSRVELGRIVGEHHCQLPSADQDVAVFNPYGSLESQTNQSA
jgi:DNA-binding CsgD family transcriptional regulator